MSDNNESEIKRKCPFNGEECGDWCPRYVEVVRMVGAQRQRAGMCVDVANNLMLSEINQKTVLPQQTPKVQLPDLQFGRG